MTVHEMYDQSIRQLPIGDRLLLVRLIMDEAAPDETEVKWNEKFNNSRDVLEDLYDEGVEDYKAGKVFTIG